MPTPTSEVENVKKKKKKEALITKALRVVTAQGSTRYGNYRIESIGKSAIWQWQSWLPGLPSEREKKRKFF